VPARSEAPQVTQDLLHATGERIVERVEPFAQTAQIFAHLDSEAVAATGLAGCRKTPCQPGPRRIGM